MAVTLEELEVRVLTLEREIAILRQTRELQPSEDIPVKRGAQLLRDARTNHPAHKAAIAKAFAEMGVTCKPIGAEKVQEMVAACGFKPEDNEFSRGIIAMREE